MRLLLDTHALIWSFAKSERLSAVALETMTRPSTRLFASAASVYEIEYKRARGAEAFTGMPADLLRAGARFGLRWLDISAEHARAAAHLDQSHKDPWDRLIAAQAIVGSMTVVTRDAAIARLGADVVW